MCFVISTDLPKSQLYDFSGNCKFGQAPQKSTGFTNKPVLTEKNKNLPASRQALQSWSMGKRVKGAVGQSCLQQEVQRWGRAWVKLAARGGSTTKTLTARSGRQQNGVGHKQLVFNQPKVSRRKNLLHPSTLQQELGQGQSTSIPVPTLLSASSIQRHKSR